MRKEQLNMILMIITGLVIFAALFVFMAVFGESASSIRVKGAVIDENTVIRAEQAESVADHIGDYGWDSRGAYFKYYDQSGTVSGDLGLILFCDENGTAYDRMWDEWGNSFPDWWGRMLVEKVRNSVSPDKIKDVRRAFANSMTFECTWVIAIGIKSDSIGSGPYLTLRTDDTLRAAYHVDTASLDPTERLFSGDEMSDSLSVLLAGEKWGTTSQRVFKERNPYIYRVTIKSYSVRIYATDCSICAKSGKRAGDHCSHKNKDLMLVEVPIVYDGKACYGEESFVWQGQVAQYREPGINGYHRTPMNDDLTQFYGQAQNGSIVAEKDSVLYLLYEEDESTVEPVPTGGVDGGGTPEPGDPEPGAPEPGDPEPGMPEPGDPDPGSQEPEEPESTSPPRPQFDAIPDEAAETLHGSVSLEAMDPLGKAEIRSDIFSVRNAIPSTESVYIKASAREYLYRIRAETISGKIPLYITVGVPYVLIWEDEDGNEQQETGISEMTTVIYRDYSYIHLVSLELHFLENITIANSALVPERTELKPQNVGVRYPTAYSPIVYGGDTPAFGGNIDHPYGYSPYILSNDVITVIGNKNKPSIPTVSAEEAYWTAQNRIGKLLCRNDEFKMDSNDVLGESGWHEYGTGSMRINMPLPKIVEFNTADMFGADYISIPARKRNGTYRTTSRMVKYQTSILFGAPGSSYDAMIEVNPVQVFTPVLCKVSIDETDPQNPNSIYFQENREIPDDAFLIVSGRSNSLGASGAEHSSEDFIININNKGYHPIYSGRLSSDYDYSLNVSRLNGETYIGGNYLRFPFAVYKDVGNDMAEANDLYVPKNTWVSIYGSQRFYPGEVIPEGYYVIEAETTAVNAYGPDERGTSPPVGVNNAQNEYVAVDHLRVYVSGKVYGLTLIDISSKADWENVFTVSGADPSSGYPVNKYLKYIGELSLNTKRLDNDGTLRSGSIDGKYRKEDIPPRIFYYTAGTKNELGIDTGRHEKYTFPMIADSHPDSTKSNKGVLKMGYRWRFRLKSSGYTMGLDGSRITVNVRYSLVDTDGRREEVDIYVPAGRGLIQKITPNINISKPWAYSGGIQVWDFELAIPEGSRIVLKNRQFSMAGLNYKSFSEYMAAKGIVDPEDEVWIKEGVIAVNFAIKAYSPSGDEIYSYLHEGGNSHNMWKIEGQNMDKADLFGNKYHFEYGDVALMYVNKGALSDYVVDHQN
ncbi:MAG: DUF5704 domain-containing protein [Lachnospiraceae bacterium]|nr:DUF5704 domain-containing protein [Lachnospiraceae bacterium]